MSLSEERSFRLIAPFLRPVMGLLEDDSVSEVMVNPDAVFVERDGRLEAVAGIVPDPKQVRQAALAIARSQGDDISPERPLLDTRLPDGSRVAAALPPCSFGGPMLTIRKFARQRRTLDDLASAGSVPVAVARAVRLAVDRRRNILVSGGTGTGKTTLLAAISQLIPMDERVVTIEDTVELQLERPNLIRFEARRATDSVAAVTVRDLVRAALRHRPDRIILGEVRGGEAWDLLQALNTG
ncbi:MAG: ATPase, T2SS/T4P/T4SS family, partial [Bryobacterales bacterium]|nr:ATPase, T2SS/T4P/T4SS family [Bryobacterales bacterium]